MQKVAESLRGSEAQSTFTYVSDLLLHWTIDNHLTIRFYSLREGEGTSCIKLTEVMAEYQERRAKNIFVFFIFIDG